MAINKNMILIIIATLFVSSKFAFAHEQLPHPHPHPHPHPEDPKGPVYEFSGRKFKIEPGHEQCYEDCYKSIFGGEGSPLYAEQECHDQCHNNNHGRFVMPSFNPPPHPKV